MEQEQSKLKKFLFGKINRKLILGFLMISLLVGIIGILSIYQLNKIAEPLEKDFPESISTVTETSRIDSLAQFIRYYDEVLTMSARNYAFTSDVLWKERYNLIVPELDAIIKEAIERGDDQDKEFFSDVDGANLALIEMEEESIRLVGEGRAGEATIILESGEYWKQKDIYKQGLVSHAEKRRLEYNEALDASIEVLETVTQNSRDLINDSTYLLIVFVLLALTGSLGLGYFVSKKISKPIIQLTEATRQIELKNFKSKVDIKTGDELEQLGESFNRTTEVLAKMDENQKQLEKAKTEFLSITSHELRSPMTPMKAQLQMLMGDYFGKLNKKQKESLDIVLRNTTRLDNIVVDFLEISRIEAARLKFKFIKTDLTLHINRLVKEMQGFMPEKKIKIVSSISKLPIIEVDPDRVMQVLRNLINNAKKFSPENSKIFVNVKLQDNMILFSVKDHGIGIKSDDQKKIFEPFYQAEQTMYREHQGTGLGLAIIKGIIESQNSRVWIESEFGKGTTFYFTVPLKPVKVIKPIKLLFSPTEDIGVKVKELLINYLGPLGSQEFEILNRKNLTYKSASDYLYDLRKKAIITQEVLYNMMGNLRKIFGTSKDSTQTDVNISEEIGKLYTANLGSAGSKRFKAIKKLTMANVVQDINKLEKQGVINTLKASRFRDAAMGIFRQATSNGTISTEHLKKLGLIKRK